MPTPPLIKLLRTKLHTLVSTIGIATSISITGIIVLALIVTIKLGSIHSPHNQKLVELSSDQAVLSIQFVSTIDDIDLALRTESWDMIDPSITKFTEQYNQWKTTHQELSANRINRSIKGESGLSIADHFDRIAYNKSQITQSFNELKLVTDSIVRRAPYISHSTPKQGLRFRSIHPRSVPRVSRFNHADQHTLQIARTPQQKAIDRKHPAPVLLAPDHTTRAPSVCDRPQDPLDASNPTIPQVPAC